MSCKEKIKHYLDEEHFPLWGILGSFAICIALFIPQIGYRGREGEAYSMLNHFVSELGEMGVSNLWIVFSLGLILGGFFYLLFMIGLGFYIENAIAKIAMIFGVLSSIFCMLVGFFPMNYLVPHYFVALSFFMGAMITVLVFTIAIAFQKQARIPKLFIIPGLIVFLIYLAMNLVDFSTIGENLDLESGAIIQRPEIWMLAIIEWAAVLSVMAYLLVIAIYIYLIEK